jgi:hypothetical protein
VLTYHCQKLFSYWGSRKDKTDKTMLSRDYLDRHTDQQVS